MEQQQPCDGVPPPLRAAAATLLRFYHADAASAAPAPALCREVRAVLDPATRPAVDTYGALLHQPQGDAGDAWGDPQPPFLTALPAWALAGGGAHDVQDLLPGRKLCSFLVDRNRCMLLGGPPPSDTVAGVPGGPLNVQTLMFMAAAAAKQVGLLAAIRCGALPVESAPQLIQPPQASENFAQPSPITCSTRWRACTRCR